MGNNPVNYVDPTGHVGTTPVPTDEGGWTDVTPVGSPASSPTNNDPYGDIYAPGSNADTAGLSGTEKSLAICRAAAAEDPLFWDAGATYDLGCKLVLLTAGTDAEKLAFLSLSILPGLVYGPSVQNNIAADPKHHGFPTLLDRDILSGKSVVRPDGRVEYMAKGTLNGKEGVYHMTVRGDKVIHRLFSTTEQWDKRWGTAANGLPPYKDLK